LEASLSRIDLLGQLPNCERDLHRIIRPVLQLFQRLGQAVKFARSVGARFVKRYRRRDSAPAKHHRLDLGFAVQPIAL
jgi:hypothetical protein